jgi:anti-sigma factor RsiW
VNCKAIISQVSDYIDGDINIRLKKEIELHLEDCPECKEVVRQVRLTVEIFRKSPEPDLAPDVHTRLHDTLRRRMPGFYA